MRYILPSGIVTSLAALLLVVAGASSQAAAQESSPSPMDGVTISLSKTAVATMTGETFTFTSQIANDGAGTTPPLIVHMNVVSLDESVYVDPEDWSPNRTMIVGEIPPRSSATQTWTVKPVLKGNVSIYLVLLPASDGSTAEGGLLASPALNVHIDEQRTLNPGGVLPIVLAVPGVLVAAMAGLHIVRRRNVSLH